MPYLDIPRYDQMGKVLVCQNMLRSDHMDKCGIGTDCTVCHFVFFPLRKQSTRVILLIISSYLSSLLLLLLHVTTEKKSTMIFEQMLHFWHILHRLPRPRQWTITFLITIIMIVITLLLWYHFRPYSIAEYPSIARVFFNVSEAGCGDELGSGDGH